MATISRQTRRISPCAEAASVGSARSRSDDAGSARSPRAFALRVLIRAGDPADVLLPFRNGGISVYLDVSGALPVA